MLEVNRGPAATSHGRTATAPALAQSARLQSVLTKNREPLDFNVKLPVITGECHFRRSMSIDGLLSGQVRAERRGKWLTALDKLSAVQPITIWLQR